MKNYISEDITFCIAECKNKKKCERNPKRIRHYEIPHSYSDFSKVCKDFERRADE